MSKITVKLIDPSEVPTPDAGTITYFTDINDNLYKYKDETGAVNIVSGGGSDVPYSKLTLNYSDFQPEPSIIKEIPAGNIPVGDSRMEWAVVEVTPPAPAAVGITAVQGSPFSTQIQQGQFFLSNTGDPWRAQMRVIGFGVTIDDLTAGQWELYYRFLPVTIAP